MTALTLPFLSFPTWSFGKAEPKASDPAQLDDVERRKIVGDMIAAGACDSDYGAQMLMSVFPDQY